MNTTRALTCAAGVFLAAVVAVGQAAQQAAPQTQLASATFTAAQANAGQQAYTRNCSSCHGTNLDDGEFAPPLKGVDFRGRWGGQSAEPLFTYIEERMPPSAPRSLGANGYAEILAYIFRENGLAATALVTTNTAFTVTWLNTATNPDVSAQATFTISNWSANSDSFDLVISNVKNTTATTPVLNARLTSFGFGLSPDLTSFANPVNGSTYSWAFTNINFPAFQAVDACAYAGPNCAGGGNAGLNQGETQAGTMSITLMGNFANGVTFDPLAAKFQTNDGSFELDGTPGPVCEDCVVNPNAVTPEPASMLLLGSGGIAAALARRRRRKTAA
jgi:mono/diheme cytochrome c family protein